MSLVPPPKTNHVFFFSFQSAGVASTPPINGGGEPVSVCVCVSMYVSDLGRGVYPSLAFYLCSHLRRLADKSWLKVERQRVERLRRHLTGYHRAL